MENLMQIIDTSSCVNAIYCLILYTALKIYFRRTAILQTEKKLDCEEYIICDITPFILLDYIFAFIFGYTLFDMLSLNNIDPAASSVLMSFRYIYTLGSIILLVMLSSPRTFLTNKRIIFNFGTLPLSKRALLKVRGYKYINISSCYEEKTIFGPKFTIKFASARQVFEIYSILTLCYKPAIKIIETKFDDIKETGYEIPKVEAEFSLI